MRKVLKTLITLLFLLTFTLSTSADEFSFLEGLAEKEYATYSDLLRAFCYLNGLEVDEDDGENYGRLLEVMPAVRKYLHYERPATVGQFAAMAMEYLKIKSGIFYMATRRGRYATRELMLLNIVEYNTSEYEQISGIELIRYIRKVVEYGKE